MEETFSNDDMASEVLSRLPAKTLASCKCVSKTWNSLISRPSMLRAHFERSQDLSGILFQPYQANWDHIDSFVTFVTLDEKQSQRLTDFLDFLPEKVVLMGSCNGLLCCRSRVHGMQVSEELVIYICNPHSKEWIALRPKKSEVKDAIGFAFYPFGSSLNPNPCFKLVSIHCPKGNSNAYSFLVYTSETGQWKHSEDVCHCNFKIRKNKMIFVGSRFHWLTGEHHVITFDIERELSAVIKLPGPVMNGICLGICLGVSRGCLHYVCAHVSEIRVWVLKDYGKSEWILKYSLNLSDFVMEHKKRFGNFLWKKFNAEKLKNDTVHSSLFLPLAYSEEVLFMKIGRRLYSYDFRTTELKGRCWLKKGFTMLLATVLPYTDCLAAAGVLKEGQHLGHKKIGEGNTDPSSGPKQKRRKRS